MKKNVAVKRFTLALVIAGTTSLMCLGVNFYPNQDESPLYRYFPNARKNVIMEDTLVEATIYSGTGGIISSNYTGTGHSWIMLRNLTQEEISVGHTSIEPEGIITFGTWGLVRSNPHLGLWYNLETYRYNNSVDYSDTVSYSEYWNQKQLQKLTHILLDDDLTAWKLYTNCTNFVITTWNNVSELTHLTEGYSFLTPWENPSIFYRYISRFPGHRVNYPMPEVSNDKIGYYDKHSNFNNNVGKVANGVGSSFS